MGNPIFSPDGKFMWTGTEWIPSPPENLGNEIRMQDSVIGGDVITNTTINNDPSAVTSAVISALEHLGVINVPNHQNTPPASLKLPDQFTLGEHVEYYSPSNERWLSLCKIIDINNDGTYKIEVPKSGLTEIKNGVTIGTRPGCIRPASNPYKAGDKVFVNWKNFGHFYAGIIARENEDATFLIQFDDGDIEDSVEWSRIMPLDENSDDVKDYVAHDSRAENELIEAFKVFDPSNSGTIAAQEYLRILTEMGDNPLSIDEVKHEFSELGISLDSQIDYKELAKYLVASEGTDIQNNSKPEVVIRDAKIVEGVLNGYAYNHPKLGETWLNTTEIESITYDERATARVVTLNTVYVIGPTGWIEKPINHPFNLPDYKPGQKVKVEWNGTWWDALVRETKPDATRWKIYLIHYVGFDSSWDEWVESSRIQNP